MTTEIIKEILKHVPPDKVSDVAFEAANIILYTKDKDWLFDDEGTVRKAVQAVKKRIELRPDPAICLEPEKAKEEIGRILTVESGIDEIVFDPQRSIVYIECENPGIGMANRGALLQQVRRVSYIDW